MNIPARRAAGSSTLAVRAVAAVVVTALAGLVVALVFGGAANERVIAGLGDAGTLTRWGLPIVRQIMDLGGVLTVGALLMAVALLPADNGRLGPHALRYLRATAWIAAGWAAAAAVTLIFTVSDILGEPVGQVIGGTELSSFVGQLPQGVALMFVVLLSAVIALLARTTETSGTAAGLLVLAFLALLPPPLTGHSASSPNHELAVTGLTLHIAALAPWVGGLMILSWHALRDGNQLGIAADRFSRMALWCYIAVGFTGAVNAVSRLPSPAELVTTRYGQLILAKAGLFTLLGFFGWWHRRHTLPAVAGRRPWAFARLASVEAAVMAATIGVAVALARTAPPAPSLSINPVRDLLGFDIPPPLTVARLASLWRLDLFFVVFVVVAGGLYLAGVLRLRHRGDRWPVGRTVAWSAGLFSIVLGTQSGVATYAPVLFSVHMAQHMILSMLSPIFLVLGAPVTLALRAMRPAAIKGDRGPREWLTVILHSRAMTFFGHPAVVTITFVGSTYVLYFTPLFGLAMRAHIGHILMLVHFLAAGSLFFWVLVGIDPTPHKLPYIAKLLTLFVTMPFHAFFGIALMNLDVPVGKDWYTSVHPSWAASLVSDQHTAGGIAWAFGEIPTLIVLVALVFQWFLEDQRLARRLERHAERAMARQEETELSDYNAYLASLDKHSREENTRR